MKKLTSKQYKKYITGILEYIDCICRKNNIKYTLIGGSLIGCIREGGIIPWDDDIDIILLESEYLKLIEAIKKDNNSIYQIFSNETEKTFVRPFIKIVDKRILVKEKYYENIKKYYAYVDVFCYRYISNNLIERKIVFYMQKYYMTMLSLSTNTKKYKGYKKIVAFVAKKVNPNVWLKKYKKIVNISKKNRTDYLLSDWPVYSINKEVQLGKYFEKYIDKNFEGLKVSIIENYDKVLRNIFGDYMIPPEDNKKISHGLRAYIK